MQSFERALYLLVILAGAWLLYKVESARETQNRLWMDSTQADVEYLMIKDKYDRVMAAEQKIILQTPDEGCLDRPVPDAINRVLMVDPRLPE